MNRRIKIKRIEKERRAGERPAPLEAEHTAGKVSRQGGGEGEGKRGEAEEGGRTGTTTMKSRAREQASSSIPLQGRHERGAEKNGKQMRSQGASRSENHDGKQQDMTTHEQNAKSDRQTRPEPAHNSHKSKTNDTPRPPACGPGVRKEKERSGPFGIV